MPAPNGQSPITGRFDDRDLACAEHVRQQQDGDEGRHHEIEIAQAPVSQRFRLDLYRLLFDVPHGAQVRAR